MSTKKAVVSIVFWLVILSAILGVAFLHAANSKKPPNADNTAIVHLSPSPEVSLEHSAKPSSKRHPLVKAAMAQIGVTTIYDPSYVALKYPLGDVPIERGVCRDVVIRAFREVGIDLQQAVHLDMCKHFESYPKTWGLNRPDRNIDHRRVYNLMRYFLRKGWQISTSKNPSSFLPGDIVAWKLDNNLPHIGFVSDILGQAANERQIIHNIGAGTQLEDSLFEWIILGHYRVPKKLLRTQTSCGALRETITSEIPLERE